MKRIPLPLNGIAALALAGMALAPLPAMAQAAFAKPDQAADALIDAIAANDSVAMARILGPEWRQLLPPGRVAPEDRQHFLDTARQSRAVRVNNGRGELVVGESDPWTLPIPLQQGKDGQWRFDPRGGREALRERVIGANELSTMQAMLAYVDAQREYAQIDRNGDGVLEYAQRLISRPGQRDGLIWSSSLGDESPLGEDYAPTRPGHGYHGYRFRILTAQGPHGIGGERNYLLGRRLSSGYALIAWPLRYGESGVMSFIISQDGKIYQRDLGPQTATLVTRIRRYDPDPSWRPAQP